MLKLGSLRSVRWLGIGAGRVENMGELRLHSQIAFVIDDDPAIRDALSALLRSVDIPVETFGTTGEFLRSARPDIPACLLLDVRLPDASGLDFQETLGRLGISLPIIFITGYADVSMSVQAMKAGAVEFLCKPFREEDVLRAVRSAMQKDADARNKLSALSVMRRRFDSLTPREQEVMSYVVFGMMNKQIAAKLKLSEITVKVHRASIVRKMLVKSLAELVRQAVALGIVKPEPDARSSSAK
jgi:FixJ family two-component response regulator